MCGPPLQDVDSSSVNQLFFYFNQTILKSIGQNYRSANLSVAIGSYSKATQQEVECSITESIPCVWTEIRDDFYLNFCNTSQFAVLQHQVPSSKSIESAGRLQTSNPRLELIRALGNLVLENAMKLHEAMSGSYMNLSSNLDTILRNIADSLNPRIHSEIIISN